MWPSCEALRSTWGFAFCAHSMAITMLPPGDSRRPIARKPPSLLALRQIPLLGAGLRPALAREPHHIFGSRLVVDFRRLDALELLRDLAAGDHCADQSGTPQRRHPYLGTMNRESQLIAKLARLVTEIPRKTHRAVDNKCVGQVPSVIRTPKLAPIVASNSAKLGRKSDLVLQKIARRSGRKLGLPRPMIEPPASAHAVHQAF